MPIDMRVPAHQEAVVLGPDDPASFEPRSAEQELRSIGGMCVLRNIQGVEVWLSSLFEHAMIESFELTPAYKRCLWVLERTATPIERLEVHHTYIVAVRIRDRVIAELIAYNGPEAPQPDRTVLEHLDNINANFDQAQAK